jgi:uncharacterized membrane protein
MRARILLLIDQIETGFWFLPTLMLLAAGILAFTLLHLDTRVDPGIKTPFVWAYSGSPEGARSLLTTIAGSMITAASVTFSLASVALTIASQQYGSRVLRNFMRDRITQVLLGTFVSTFVYSVLVVRAVRGTDVSGGVVPSISITVAIALSLVSLVLLIFFVHHISASIKSSHVLLMVGKDLLGAMRDLYPNSAGRPAKHSVRKELSKPGVTVISPATGYLQSIDLEALLEAAETNGQVIEILLKPGDHFVPGGPVARICGAEAIAEKERGRIRDAFLFGGERTPTQDIRYQFRQLTDVVIRSLSPGINDPFTAMNGIDLLATGLTEFARQPRVCEGREGRDGKLRLVAPSPELAEILDSTVGHIAIYSSSNRFVNARLQRLLDGLERDLVADSEISALRVLRLRLEESAAK